MTVQLPLDTFCAWNDGGLRATEASTWQLGPVPLRVRNTTLVERCQLLPEFHDGVDLFTGQ